MLFCVQTNPEVYQMILSHKYCFVYLCLHLNSIYQHYDTENVITAYLTFLKKGRREANLKFS